MDGWRKQGADGSNARRLDAGPTMAMSGPVAWAPDRPTLPAVSERDPYAEDRVMTQPMILSLDPTVPSILIADPGAPRRARWDERAGISWQREP